MDNPKSAYIIQSNIIQLNNVPFSLPSTIREPFRRIFSNENCFSDMEIHLSKATPSEFTFSPPPFIHDLGQVQFSTRSISVGRPHTQKAKIRLAPLLAREKSFWNPKTQCSEHLLYDNHFFGYDFNLKDQRLNYLHFELGRPLLIKASLNGQVLADGKIFIHFYPFGFIVIHLAIDIKQLSLSQDDLLAKAITETRPWRFDNKWNWSSRLVTGSLYEVVNIVKQKISESLFVNSKDTLGEGRWISSTKFVGKLKFPQKKHNIFDLGEYPARRTLFYSSKSDKKSKESLLITRQGITCILSPYRSRTSSLRFAWRIFSLYHFSIIKSQIYKAYTEYLTTEIVSLKEYRLNSIRKITKEDVRRLSIYDPKIPAFLAALDRHIKPVPPFYRRIYSAICDGIDFNLQRQKMLSVVSDWENEVEKWEHPLSFLWKKIVSPLRSFLGSV